MKFLKKYPVAWVLTILVVALSILFGAVTARADLLPVQPGDWVYDGANVLSSATEDSVRAYNTAFDQDYEAYVAVATVKNLRGWNADQYGERLFDRWELYANDFLLLLDVGSGQSYLYYGSNWTDFDYSSYLEQYVNPSFLKGDYDGAVTALLGAMETYLATQSGGVAGLPSGNGEFSWSGSDGSYSSQGGVNFMGILILVIVLVVAIWLVCRIIERSRYNRWYRSYGYMESPTVVYRPVFFWHRPGSLWWRRTYRPGPRPAPTPRPGSFGGAPRPGARPGTGPRPGGVGTGTNRPGTGTRPGGFNGTSRPGAGTRPGTRPGSFGGSSRPGSRPTGFGGLPRSGFGGGGRSGSSRGGFGGGSRGGFGGGSRGGHGGGGFGGGGHAGGHR